MEVCPEALAQTLLAVFLTVCSCVLHTVANYVQVWSLSLALLLRDCDVFLNASVIFSKHNFIYSLCLSKQTINSSGMQTFKNPKQYS